METVFDINYKNALEHMKKLPDQLQKTAAKSALQECAKQIKKDALARLRSSIKGGGRSTGNLLKGIITVSLPNKPGMPVKVLVGVPRKSPLIRNKQPKRSSYWLFYEKGRRGQAGKPFLKPAVDASKARNQHIIAQHINQAVEKWGVVSG